MNLASCCLLGTIQACVKCAWSLNALRLARSTSVQRLPAQTIPWRPMKKCTTLWWVIILYPLSVEFEIQNRAADKQVVAMGVRIGAPPIGNTGTIMRAVEVRALPVRHSQCAKNPLPGPLRSEWQYLHSHYLQAHRFRAQVHRCLHHLGALAEPMENALKVLVADAERVRIEAVVLRTLLGGSIRSLFNSFKFVHL